MLVHGDTLSNIPVRSTGTETGAALSTDLIIPVLVAFIVYIIADRLGEWKKRRMYSRLGVAVLHPVLEELRTGIRLMEALDEAARNRAARLPGGQLPVQIWEGNATISDEVLLRIVQTARRRNYNGFHPRECRIHCKRYFMNMCDNLNRVITSTLSLKGKQDAILAFTDPERGDYLRSSRSVEQMLVDATDHLERNTRWFRLPR